MLHLAPEFNTAPFFNHSHHMSLVRHTFKPSIVLLIVIPFMRGTRGWPPQSPNTCHKHQRFQQRCTCVDISDSSHQEINLQVARSTICSAWCQFTHPGYSSTVTTSTYASTQHHTAIKPSAATTIQRKLFSAFNYGRMIVRKGTIAFYSATVSIILREIVIHRERSIGKAPLRRRLVNTSVPTP
jgi:hypothetical protein